MSVVTGKSTDCACGSSRPFEQCCGPLLSGAATAHSAEQLMRSRYTAYTWVDQTYLEQTWHASTRPATLRLHDEPRPNWDKLLILNTVDGQPGDTTGSVEFMALYRVEGRNCRLHEISRFVRENGRWYYLDGTAGPGIGRNSPCPCGSGSKFKRCCGK